MTYYQIYGIDKDGLAYTYRNETMDWTLRGVRRESQCFGLVEMLDERWVYYSWNPVDGYTYDPTGAINQIYVDFYANQKESVDTESKYD